MQAINFLQLFRLLEADLSASKPPPAQRSQDTLAAEPGFENAFAEETPTTGNGSTDAPNYPKSLFLLRPLFTGYEMNSIGYKAQESVRLPDDLDLDATLVDWAPDDATLDFDFPAEEEDAEEAPEREMGHGGGANLEELRRVLKASGGKSKKGKTRRLKDDGTEETPEERAAVSGDLLPRNVVAGSYCPHSARQHARLNKRVIRTIYRIRRRMSMSMAFPS